jgi:hypothetical protein
MVDYSKWDKFDVSDSDDEDARRFARPVVTKLDATSTVTIPAAGSAAAAQHQITAVPEREDRDEEWDDTGAGEDYYDSYEDRKPPAWFAGGSAGSVSAGATISKPDWTRNGYRTPSHMFCQGADEVTITVFVPAGTKAKDVGVVVSKSGELSVRIGGQSHLTKQLAHEVEGMDRSASTTVLASSKGDDDADDTGIDWELLDFDDNGVNQRLVRITLKKRPPAGLRVWWRKAFTDDPHEVDISSISDRGVVGGVDATTSKKMTMQEVWEAAHVEFRKRIAAMKPTEVNVSSSGGDDNEN